MGLVLEAPDVWRELLGTSAEPGIFSKSLEARFESITVASGLLNTKLFDAVISDFVNVSGGTAR